MVRQIEVSVDTFAAIWSARLEHEKSEDEIIARLAKVSGARRLKPTPQVDFTGKNVADGRDLPIPNWIDLLVWTLKRLGGRAPLAEIYRVSREARKRIDWPPTRDHDASARECLEANCRDSKKWRQKRDIFWMPDGKGAGVWALR